MLKSVIFSRCSVCCETLSCRRHQRADNKMARFFLNLKLFSKIFLKIFSKDVACDRGSICSVANRRVLKIVFCFLNLDAAGAKLK